MKITSGKEKRAQKVVIYGAEGVGKTSLAARFPNPLFIDTEGGTSHLDVKRVEKPESFSELIEIVKEVSEKKICKTLVIDTLDWAEQLATHSLLLKYHQKSIESFGYGKGYTYLSDEFEELIRALDLCIKSNIHVCLVAHAKMRKFEQPDEMGAYDRWEMKLSKNVAPLFKEWCDLLLFLNYKTYVVTSDSQTKKAQGGSRVIYTSHHPCWDAKNRHGLADELPLSFDSIAEIFGDENKTDEVKKLLREKDIEDDELLGLLVLKKKSAAKSIEELTQAECEFVIKNFEKISKMIKGEQ